MEESGFMQQKDPEAQKAKKMLLPFFTDKYGRPLRKPYYMKQLQVLLETRFFPWIVSQAVNELVEEGHLSRVEVSTKYHEKVIFFFNKRRRFGNY